MKLNHTQEEITAFRNSFRVELEKIKSENLSECFTDEVIDDYVNGLTNRKADAYMESYTPESLAELYTM